MLQLNEQIFEVMPHSVFLKLGYFFSPVKMKWRCLGMFFFHKVIGNKALRQPENGGTKLKAKCFDNQREIEIDC